ncbi:YciI family protein [Hylemonella sp. W303a]|uniref:YciI family protein n=1 Tax=Hylemonella sp. W303a TaxID=3389873 RepID=UPI00396B4708
MFVVVLGFSTQRAQAALHLAGHQAWLKQGLDEGVFLLAGSLRDRGGGALLAHGLTREALQARVQQDPFVVADVVRAEIMEITPSLADARLRFLLPEA